MTRIYEEDVIAQAEADRHEERIEKVKECMAYLDRRRQRLSRDSLAMLAQDVAGTSFLLATWELQFWRCKALDLPLPGED